MGYGLRADGRGMGGLLFCEKKIKNSIEKNLKKYKKFKKFIKISKKNFKKISEKPIAIP